MLVADDAEDFPLTRELLNVRADRKPSL